MGSFSAIKGVGGRKGRVRGRKRGERGRGMQRKGKRKREVGRVSPFKERGYGLPCVMHSVRSR